MIRSAMNLALRTLAAASLCTLAACASDTATGPGTTEAAAGCPAKPVDVVVSVDQWGDIVSELGGACAKVTTVLASSSVDPHDYEPSPADAASFQGAQLVVMNGGHYDEWAAKLAEGSAPEASVVSAITGEDRQNPHVWYDPETVTSVADRVTAALQKLSPDAAGYFTERRGAFTKELEPYHATIASIRANAVGRTYAATEGVFDYMATAVGLQDRTPSGYAAAARNDTDPSPADLDAFLKVLQAKGVSVLIYNTQTEGTVPEQLRAAAESAGVPVVDVTETVAPGAKSFEAWQVDQLSSLAKALGVNV